MGVVGVLVPDVEAGVEGGTGVEVPEGGGVFIGTSGILAMARDPRRVGRPVAKRRYAELAVAEHESVLAATPAPPTLLLLAIG